MQKLQGMKAKLKLWNKDNFGNIKEKKEAIIKDITMVDFYEAEDALWNELITLRAIKKVELKALFFIGRKLLKAKVYS